MIQYERQNNILEILEKQRSSSVKELSAAVFASEASVRRDLELLERHGYISRFYGGVMLTKYKNSIVPIDLRDSNNSAAKEKVSQEAAELVSDGMTIMIDASSTARRMLRYLDKYHDLKIITNNLSIFNENTRSDFRLFCTGGQYSQKNHAFYGPAAEEFIHNVSADILFFSSQGISDEGEISDVSEEETSLRRVMLGRTQRQVFLCDGSKLGVRKMFTLCRKEDITDIICDITLPPKLLKHV